MRHVYGNMQTGHTRYSIPRFSADAFLNWLGESKGVIDSLRRNRTRQAVNDDVTLAHQAPIPASARTISQSMAGALPTPAQAPGTTPLPAAPSVPSMGATPLPAPTRQHPRLAWLPRMRPARINIRLHTLDSLRHRDFRLLWLSTACLGGGFWIQQLTVGWLAYELTRSAFFTSLAVGTQNLPCLIGGPMGGVVADRWDRRRLLMAVFLSQAAITAGFAAVLILGRAEPWHVFAFAAAIGTAWAVSDPARVAIIPNVVPRQNLVNVYALNGLAFNATRFIMPVLAGFLIVWLGAGHTVLLGTVAYLGASTALFLLRTSHAGDTDGPRSREKGSFTEGLRYVKGEPLVMAIILMGLMPPLLFGPFINGLLPVYASEVYGVGAPGLGFLMAAIGVGSIVGTTVLASVGDVRYKGRILIASLAAVSAMMLLFSRSGSYELSLPLVALLFVAVMSYFITGSALMQSLVPDHLRGRVSSIGIMVFGFSPLGSLVSGTLAQQFGVQTATSLAACTMAVLLVVVSLKFRVLWSYK